MIKSEFIVKIKEVAKIVTIAVEVVATTKLLALSISA